MVDVRTHYSVRYRLRRLLRNHHSAEPLPEANLVLNGMIQHGGMGKDFWSTLLHVYDKTATAMQRSIRKDYR